MKDRHRVDATVICMWVCVRERAKERECVIGFCTINKLLKMIGLF